MTNAAVFPAFLRLQVEDTGAFPKLIAESKGAADQVSRHFRGSADEIKKSLASAMSGPLGAVPDLGTGKFREAAQAAEERARALRLMSAAAEGLANDERALSGAQQVYIQRIREATQAGEEEARTLRERANFFDQLQVKMATTGAAADRFATGQTRIAASSGQLRSASQQLSYQISDVAGSFAMGINPMMIFAQQGSQVVQAITLMQGEAKGFMGFLGGPWGAAIIGAVTIAGMLGAKYLEMGNEVSKATDELKKSARQADATRQAKELFARTMDGVTEALNLNRDALKQMEDQDESAARRAMESAISSQTRLKTIRNETAGLLEQAKAARERNLQILGGIASPAGKEFAAQNVAPAQDRIASIEASLAKTDAAIAESGRQLAEATSRRFVEIGRMSPEDRIKRRYDGLIEAARERAVAEGKVTGEIVRQTKALTDQRDKEIKALQRSQRAVAKPRETGRQITGGEADSILAGIGASVTSGKRSPEHNRAVGGAPNSYHLSDQARDIAKTPGMSLAKIRSAFQDRGVRIRELLDEGDHFHVAWGKVQDAAAAAAKATHQLDTDLTSVVRALDPAQAAAEAYADELERIDRLEKAGRISAADAGTLRHTAAIASIEAQEQAAEQARAKITSQLSDGLQQATLRPITDLGNSATAALVGAGEAGADAFRDAGILAADSIAAVFGRKAGSAAAILTGNYGALGGPLGRLMSTVSAMGAKHGDQARIQLPAGGSLPGGPLIVRPGEEFVTDLAKGVDKGMSAVKQSLDRLIDHLAQAANSAGIDAGAIGKALPILAVVAEATSAISNLIGVKDRTGPLGGVLGNVLLDRIIGSKRGSSTISFSGGTLGASTSGNSAKFKAATNDAVDTAMANITRIAEALGATITGTGAVSIGIRDGKYRVDNSGKGITKTKKGALDFGEDAAAAVKAATLNLLQDGMLAGLRAGTQRLLQNTKDLDAGLAKALKFEGVFQELKRRIDPVGAALDEVNRRFFDLKNVFTEAGASAAELADLEKLYGLERKEAVEKAGEAMTSTLQGLLDDLRGNNDAFSLRDRLDMARAKYDPLAAEIAAGNYQHADAFAEATRGVEAIVREIEGSQKGYFDFLDQATGLTKGALDAQNALIATASGTSSPFGPGEAPKDQPVVSAIDKLGSYLVNELGGGLRAVNDNIGRTNGSLDRVVGLLAGGGGRYAVDLSDRANF